MRTGLAGSISYCGESPEGKSHAPDESPGVSKIIASFGEKNLLSPPSQGGRNDKGTQKKIYNGAHEPAFIFECWEQRSLLCYP